MGAREPAVSATSALRAPRAARPLAALAVGALAFGGCSTAPKTWVVQCSAASQRPPRPSAECLVEPDSQRYVVQIAGEIGEGLSGYATHPGQAEISVAFDAGSRVADVCFGSVHGGVIEQRIPQAAARVNALPPAPACFAGRRLDFAWESDTVTREEVRVAVAECRREVEPYRRRVLFIQDAQSCYEKTGGCSGDAVRRRWNDADRALRSCVLGRIPLVVRTGVTHEELAFAPAVSTTPDPELAKQAMKVCNGLPRVPDVVECMGRRGWEPLPYP
jgi:hypothetical protein